MPLRDERGLTLTELTVVGVLATLVMLALTGFYFNSQRTWLEGSSQALTQREATLIVDHLADRVRASSSASASGAGDLQELSLHGPGGEQTWLYRVEADSLLHEYDESLTDRGPIATSVVRRFQLETSDSLVAMPILELRSATGDQVRIGSRFALYNR